MAKKNIAIEQIKSEVEDDYSNDDLYNINSWGADLSFRELITMYEEGELLKPELQRHYVWDKTEASRFIDSLLLGLPVPGIFLAKTKDNINLIVDGYQRIMTVHDYVKGIFSEDNQIFKISRSDKINERWRGKAFTELSDTEKRKIRGTTIHAIVFEQIKLKNGDTGLYQVFERINTSGRTLLPQEIRNCVYQGPFNDLLMSLNKNPNWRKLYGSEEIDNRMRDVEFILRFMALRFLNFEEVKTTRISMKKHLNEFMETCNKYSDEELTNLKDAFINAMDYILSNIGHQAFNNISSKDSKIVKRFHPTIFDAISIATSHYLEKNNDKIENLPEKRIKLLKDEKFIKYISERTTDIEHIKSRISIAYQYLYGAGHEQ